MAIIGISGTIYIYTLKDPRTNSIRYVGKTHNLTRRLTHHLVDTVNPTSVRRQWIRELISLDLKPIINIIDIVPEEESTYWEEYWIWQLKCWGFNLTNQLGGKEGDSMINSTTFKKGTVPWNKETVGYSTSKKGSTVPQEIRDKISKTLIGSSNRPKRLVKQIDVSTGKIINQFNSIKEASEATKIKYSSIANALTGRAKTSGGYVWL